MSHAFVENDADYDASPRVYVNNMNTPHATVTLPVRRRNNHSHLFMRPNEGTTGNADSTGGAGYAESFVNAGRGALGGSGRGAAAHAYREGGGRDARAGLGHGNEPTTAHGAAVHPNLQDVYSRIMRRLQREMNYAEFSRASLAEQYGVNLDLQCEDEERAAAMEKVFNDGGERDRPRVGAHTAEPMSFRAPLQAFSSQPDNEGDAFDEARRFTSPRPSLPASRPPPSGGSGNRVGDAAGAGEPLPSQPKDVIRSLAGGTSQLLQFKQQPLPAAGAPTSSFDDRTGVRSDADVEREMAEQPCPRPLRLVVQHVLDTLQKKMTLAENGSLRDCIIFSFESRALLDRLLKEIPLYTQYAAYSSASGHGGCRNSVAVQQAVSGVYQQLRRRPVLLPRGEYVEEADTGAIHAELVGSGDGGGGNADSGRSGNGTGNGNGGGVGALASITCGATRLPNINALPVTITNNTVVHNTNNTNTSNNLSAQTQLPEVPLPASYGKSTRLAASVARQHNAAAGGTPQLPSQRSLGHPILRDHMSTSNAAAQSFGEVSEMVASTMAEQMMGGGCGDEDQSSGSNSNRGRRGLASDAAAAHRVTQLVSVGTITEENGVTTVPQSAYAALQQRIEELQTQLADAQQHRSALADQLCEEEQYTDQKKRIVQYLRETLLRECNMLRTQLHHATAVSASTSPATGKGTHAQRAAGMGATGLHKDTSFAASGLGGSMHHGHARQQKQSNAAALSTSTPMAASAVMQQKPRVDCRSGSGSLGSMYAGSLSVAAGTGGGGAGRSMHRSSQQSRNGGNGGGGGGGGSNNNTSNSLGGGGGHRNSPGHTTTFTSSRSDGFHTELDAVHSLLDLALLAVEEEAVLPSHTVEQLQSGLGDAEVLHSGFRKNAKQQLDELRADFEGRQQALKQTLLHQTAEHNFVVGEQQAEVARLRALTDMSSVRETLQASVGEIRAELNLVRMHVAEQLHFFKAILHSTGQGLIHRAALVDSTMSDNVTLTSTLNAMKELIESASSLFLPMLTREYECGYHPWPLKVRNTCDPLGHIVQLRFGTAEVLRLRDSLTEFGKLYEAIHLYVMKHAVLPESARPATGKPLEYLCAALALNPTSYTDAVFAARRCHDVEGQLRKKLVRLQSRILWNAYLQHVLVERSIAALAEAGIDPRVAMLPVARRIDVLAQQRGDLLQARVKIQRERAENAKEVYRLWREKEIDIMEGYPMPQTQRNQLTLLNSSGAVNSLEGGAVGKANPRSSRFASFFQRLSADSSGSPNSSSL
ncbi:hypothetical protein ABB37_07784 [Leptomonas pyrrhocoris]|uniref:Uncharacterized protein n=1 Tax=Leptomonas pyrrhocoris TaxID=157538 RepID=A0A0N0DSV0_LEPPY|nr:hypothetical protein ABB37_07784 [Leptomonas pyrrhocoris]XP_015654912.1 hypothetical protein ABB37_07784 [Leptomonas pyrrhocoris]KPA76472.1 hypothetical protein ABB37_07784 [Leptomonas pyrrhocoris]KPA76473.1 hypothetical protein ABB37_07784 [Leptomonas pyrrhocoris]|eukprot:XP_015654911.1 hypothetical protein ABB37_07784 [Leptomonas pyrrhocoris]